jgi:FkbM family methyltransferase
LDIYKYILPYIKGKLVFDVGSNIGKITKILVQNKAKVISIEPITKLTLDNPNYKKATIINACVSNNVGKIPFYECRNSSAISTCYASWQLGLYKPKDDKPLEKFWHPPVKLPCVTLDSLIKDYGIPFYIKIDVEGYEDKVFAGLSQKIQMISFEYTGGYPKIIKKILNKVNELGYTELIAFEVNKTEDGNFKIEKRFENTKEFHKYYMGLKQFTQGDIFLKG